MEVRIYKFWEMYGNQIAKTRCVKMLLLRSVGVFRGVILAASSIASVA